MVVCYWILLESIQPLHLSSLLLVLNVTDLSTANFTTTGTFNSRYGLAVLTPVYSADIGVLLRVLHDVPSVKRDSFFNEVRQCRRRVQRDWKETAVAPAISQQDEYPYSNLGILGIILTQLDTLGLNSMPSLQQYALELEVEI